MTPRNRLPMFSSFGATRVISWK
jgi:hypothetical protein